MLITVGVLVGAVPGCGGDGMGDASAGPDGGQAYKVEASTTMTTASPLITKSQFISSVNKICREAWATVIDNYAVYSGTQDPKLSKRERTAEAIQLSLLAGLDFHIFDNIRFTGAPKGDEQEIEEIIGPFQAAVELGWKKKWISYSVVGVSEHFAQFNERARKYGLNDCLVDQAHLEKIKA